MFFKSRLDLIKVLIPEFAYTVLVLIFIYFYLFIFLSLVLAPNDIKFNWLRNVFTLCVSDEGRIWRRSYLMKVVPETGRAHCIRYLQFYSYVGIKLIKARVHIKNLNISANN